MASGASRKSSLSCVGRKSSLDSVADNVESTDQGAPPEAEKISLEDMNNNEAASDTEEQKKEEGFPDEEPPKKTRNLIVSFSKSTLGGSDVR